MNRFTHVVAAAGILVSAILVGCGGGGGGLSDPGLSNVQVEVANARSADIGPDGGTITATGSNGFVYTLTIPEGAVLQQTRIAMYPIAALKNLPSGGTIRGGVNFAPEGFQLSIPATLTIQVPSSIDPKKAVPIAYTGNGDFLHLDLGTVTGQTITIPIYHFSGTALGDRTIADLLSAFRTQTAATIQFQHLMADAFWRSEESNTSPKAEYLPILRDWYNQIVRPKLIAGGNSTSSEDMIISGVNEYTIWLDGILYAQRTLGDPAFNIQPENNESEPLAVTLLKRWYQFYNDQCKADKNKNVEFPLNDANLAVRAGARADQWHISRSANGLDKETLLNNLCVKVVIESKSFTGNPDALGLAKVTAGFTIDGGTRRHDAPIRIKLSGNGVVATDTITVVNGDAAQSGVLWPKGVDPLKINILASLKDYSDIAVFDVITKNAPAPDPDPNPGSLYINHAFSGTLDVLGLPHSNGALAVFRIRPGETQRRCQVTAVDVTGDTRLLLDNVMTNVTNSGFSVQGLTGTATVTDLTTPGGDLRLKLDFTFKDPSVPAFFITFHGTFTTAIP